MKNLLWIDGLFNIPPLFLSSPLLLKFSSNIDRLMVLFLLNPIFIPFAIWTVQNINMCVCVCAHTRVHAHTTLWSWFFPYIFMKILKIELRSLGLCSKYTGAHFLASEPLGFYCFHLQSAKYRGTYYYTLLFIWVLGSNPVREACKAGILMIDLSPIPSRYHWTHTHMNART